MSPQILRSNCFTNGGGGRRVAPVLCCRSCQVVGAPGPSLLGTGEEDVSGQRKCIHSDNWTTRYCPLRLPPDRASFPCGFIRSEMAKIQLDPIVLLSPVPKSERPGHAHLEKTVSIAKILRCCKMPDDLNQSNRRVDSFRALGACRH